MLLYNLGVLIFEMGFEREEVNFCHVPSVETIKKGN